MLKCFIANLASYALFELKITSDILFLLISFKYIFSQQDVPQGIQEENGITYKHEVYVNH